MTESGSYVLSRLYLFRSCQPLPKKEDGSHKQYYLGSFHFVKTLDKHLPEISLRFSDFLKTSYQLIGYEIKTLFITK